MFSRFSRVVATLNESVEVIDLTPDERQKTTAAYSVLQPRNRTTLRQTLL